MLRERRRELREIAVRVLQGMLSSGDFWRVEDSELRPAEELPRIAYEVACDMQAILEAHQFQPCAAAVISSSEILK